MAKSHLAFFSLLCATWAILVALFSKKVSGETCTPLFPCGHGLENFVPRNSPAYSFTYTKIAQDCQDSPSVPLLFTKANAYAYSTDYCFITLGAPHTECNNMKNSLQSTRKAKKKLLARTFSKMDFVQEGFYQVIGPQQLARTAGIGTCVGVAITSSSTPETAPALLAHVNGENIFAHDAYLKGHFSNPFAAIKAFVQENRHLNLEATVVSGAPANIAYMQAVLEEMDLNKITLYCETKWSSALVIEKKSTKEHLFLGDEEIGHGSIMIERGKVLLIENAGDFKKLVPTIAQNLKNKPATLKSK